MSIYMIAVWIGVGIFVMAFIALLVVSIQEGEDIEESIGFSLFGGGVTVLMYALIAMVIIFFGVIIVNANVADKTDVTERDLVGMSVSSGLSGSVKGGLFLTTGSVGTEGYYVVATQNKEGVAQIEQLPMKSVTYIESDTETPRVIETVHYQDTSHGWAKLFRLEGAEYSRNYLIYIPRGSLIQNTTVDLGNI